MSRLLSRSNLDEQQRLIQYRDRLLKSAEIIELTTSILTGAAAYETLLDLRPQDAIVYASVISHLRRDKPLAACFLNRNRKDFDNPDIVNELKRHNCRMISRFDDGYSFIHSQA